MNNFTKTNVFFMKNFLKRSYENFSTLARTQRNENWTNEKSRFQTFQSASRMDDYEGERKPNGFAENSFHFYFDVLLLVYIFY